MKKIEAILQPSRSGAVKVALFERRIEGMTVTGLCGHGRQKGHTEVYRRREHLVDLLPKVKLDVVLPDTVTDNVVATILKTAKKCKIGDGKIFMSNAEDAIRILNGKHGETAL